MYEGTFTLGEYIRSHDFINNEQCYVEGRIVAIHEDAAGAPLNWSYEIRVEVRVWDGVEADVTARDSTVFAPMDASFAEWDGRLRVVTPRNEPLTVNDTENVPEAACATCGGWSVESGVARFARDRLVHNRTACVCHKLPPLPFPRDVELWLMPTGELAGYLHLIRSVLTLVPAEARDRDAAQAMQDIENELRNRGA